jgi:hypothetical protein
MDPEKAGIARQWHDKHVWVATVMSRIIEGVDADIRHKLHGPHSFVSVENGPQEFATHTLTNV